MMNSSKPSILLVDDDKQNLDDLGHSLEKLLEDDAAVIRWYPSVDEGSLADAFASRLDDATILVITDYDLTTSVNGLFGHSIVGWCQNRSIPVGDFSRNFDALPSEPNLFELRVPTDQREATDFIANTFRGFHKIRRWLEDHPEALSEHRSLAGVLAAILNNPQSESQFAAYTTKLGASNSALLQKLKDFAGSPDSAPDDSNKTQFLTYVLGHVLSNAILRYPGPILSAQVLCAYLATAPHESESLIPLFRGAKYEGPFSEGIPLFWRDEVDSILDEMAASISEEQFESFGDFNRKAAEAELGRRLSPHSCSRCEGLKGGYWCPFTVRPVCERGDCSVPASSWIPSGAQISRIERDFHDEWAPILGL